MAGRRVAKTAINWARLGEKVHPANAEVFRAFKHQNDECLQKVHAHPESLPKIDFAMYKRMLPNTALVEQFEKMYGSVDVPYPTDKDNNMGKIDEESAQAAKDSAAYIQSLQKDIATLKELQGVIDSVPPPEEMTYQMFYYYYPEKQVPEQSIFPHNYASQPGSNYNLEDPGYVHKPKS